jgi:exodeoxyribonuclease VIII
MAERHVMIDLETLGRRPGCAIASIGAVDFDPAGGDDFVAGEFYRAIDWQTSGLALEPETVAWWLGQPAEARIELCDPDHEAWELAAALRALASYLGEGADDDLVLWCQGASFDFPILGGAYDHCGMERPWKYWQERCARTVRKLAGDALVFPPRAEADKHHALRDAAHQVRCVQAALKALRGG